MLNLIVADDEEYVRDLIVKCINGFADFHVAGVASNGKEALSVIEQIRPDIVVTDICMPGISGLELIRTLKDRYPDVKTVIISGYDEFSYAKSAMTLGVSDYLLKPFSPAEIEEVLKKIKSELEAQNALSKNLSEMKMRLEASEKNEQNAFLYSLIMAKTVTEKDREEAKRLHIFEEDVLYCTGIVKVKSGDPDMIYELIDISKQELFDDRIRVCVLPGNGKHIIFVFASAYRQQSLFHAKIREGIDKLASSVEKHYKTKVWCALGNVYNDIAMLHKSYEEAVLVWKGVLNESEATISFKDQENAEKIASSDRVQRPKELESSLTTCIRMGQAQKAKEVLSQIMDFYSGFSVELMDYVGLSLIDLVFSISAALSATSKEAGIVDDEETIEYLKQHMTSGSLMEAKNVLEKYVDRCCESFSHVYENQGEKIVDSVKKLVEDNIGNEEFGLETVGDALFFSVNYIRQIFKTTTGESFMEYLIRRRMEQAACLLDGGDRKVAEVALLCGYSNQRYFASAFKKYYGMTPTEYKEGVRK
ncbi:MAG: response regulator [Lachnospiraceae bacterium]|nr:response regulator [Lachnospiraceae bacterium]